MNIASRPADTVRLFKGLPNFGVPETKSKLK